MPFILKSGLVIVLSLVVLTNPGISAPVPSPTPASDDQAVGAGAGVKITMLNRFRKISAPGFEVRIAPDGCVTTLLVLRPGENYRHVPSFVKPGVGLPHESAVGGSRGAFFYQDGIIPLPDIHEEGDSAIVAASAKASVRYEFAPFGMKWTVTNETDRAMQYLMVVDQTVTAVMPEGGGIVKTPAIGLWPTTTWFQNANRKLRITGGDRVWSVAALTGQSWMQGQHQIWEATLAPKEKRVIEFTISTASKEEAAAVTALAPLPGTRGAAPSPMIALEPGISGDIRVFSPCDYQVFQRQTRTQGNILLEGDVRPDCDKFQVRVTGSSITGPLSGKWTDVAVNRITRGFHESIPAPAGGWYRVDFRTLINGEKVAEASLEHVGVGEVFVTCGQSNSTNCGPWRTRTQTDMVSAFDGDEWRLGDDPLPGARDSSEWGSPWPSFGDAMVARYHVPIGIAITGIGGAPVQTWSPGTAPFLWTMDRINRLGPGGFRAMLWHQGESNAKDTSEFYFNTLSATIAASHAVAGWYFPWFVAQTSYSNPTEASHANPRDGQKRLWTEGLAFEGPDTDTLTGPDIRAGAHFSPKGLKAHGELWAEKVSVYLDRVLGNR